MIPTKAIELAKKGGWNDDGFYRWSDNNNQAKVYLKEKIALSKDFWVCLGKELAWRKWDAGDEHPTGDAPEAWTHYAIRFCRLILTEQDTTEFWAQILPDTQKSL